MKSIQKILLFGAMLAGVYASPIQAQNIVNNWSFNGNVNDTSGNNNNGTWSGGWPYVSGPFGAQGLYLPPWVSVTTTTAVGLPTAGSSSWSMNVWLNIDAATSPPQQLSYYAGFGNNYAYSPDAGSGRGLFNYPDPYIAVWGNSDDFNTMVPWPWNQWFMLTCTYDGVAGVLTVYTNSVEIASASWTYANIPAAYTGDIQVGDALWGNGAWFSIADFTIWSGALSPSQVASMYASNGIPSLAPTIVTQPSPVTAYAGNYASMSVTAGGTGPWTYQWQRSNTNLLGQTNATIVFYPIAVADAGTYTVIVSNNSSGVTSAPTVVTVYPAVTAITEGLAAYWNFAEPNGLLVKDVSGNGNNGEMWDFVGDGSERVPGLIGQALHFRGAAHQDYVQITNSNIIPPSYMTISGWVYVDADAVIAANSILKNWPGDAGDDQVHFGLSGGENSCYIGNPQGGNVGPVIDNTPLPVGQWTHVAFTADGANLNIYRNGVLSGTPFPYSGVLNTNVDPATGENSTMALGAKLDSTGLPDGIVPGFWQGSMDDLAVWNRALSPQEILSIYTAGTNGQALTNAYNYLSEAILPVILTQPQSAPLTRNQGECVPDYSVLAEGTGIDTLRYQWTINGVAITGATNSVFAPGPLAASGVVTIRVVVTDTGSTNSITSAPGTVNVIPVNGVVTGLAAHWTFYESNGFVVHDVSGNGNNGQMFSFIGDGSERIPGQVGQALHFRGPSYGDYVQITNCNVAPSNTMSVAGWFYLSTTDADNFAPYTVILANWPDSNEQIFFCVAPTGGGLLTFLGGSSSIAETNASFPIGQWVHIAFTADGVNLNMYRDGALSAPPVPYGDVLNTSIFTDSLCLGAKLLADGTPAPCSDGCAGYWTGAMDDVAIWNRGLSPAEINAIYVAGLAGQSAMSQSSLSISKVGSSVNLIWQGGTLQSASSLAGPWTPVNGATAPSCQVTPGGSQMFYRIHP